MKPILASYISEMVLTSYILCFIALNVMALFISLFYRKKFKTNSPRTPFLVSAVLAIGSCIMILMAGSVHQTLLETASIVLAVGGLASMVGTLRLFFIMRSVGK